MLDYQALKAADAALGIADPAAAASVLSAQTVTTVRDIPTEDARSVTFATGEYGALVLLSRTTPSETIPATLVAAAITAVAAFDKAKVIEATDPTKWAAVQAMLGAFVTAGVISEATRGTLLAMRNAQAPQWPVAITEHDITHARSL